MRAGALISGDYKKKEKNWRRKKNRSASEPSMFNSKYRIEIFDLWF